MDANGYELRKKEEERVNELYEWTRIKKKDFVLNEIKNKNSLCVLRAFASLREIFSK